LSALVVLSALVAVAAVVAAPLMAAEVAAAAAETAESSAVAAQDAAAVEIPTHYSSAMSAAARARSSLGDTKYCPTPRTANAEQPEHAQDTYYFRIKRYCYTTSIPTSGKKISYVQMQLKHAIETNGKPTRNDNILQSIQTSSCYTQH